MDNLSSDEESNDDKENDVRLIDLSVLRHVIGHLIQKMEMRYLGREGLTNNKNLVTILFINHNRIWIIRCPPGMF